MEPLQDHADGAQLAVHPLQSPLPGHLVDETQPLNTLALRFVALAKALNDANVGEPSSHTKKSSANVWSTRFNTAVLFKLFEPHFFLHNKKKTHGTPPIKNITK